MIIGLCGAARSGKDTVATLLADALGGSHKRIQVAAPLKAYLRELFDWTEEHTDGDLKDQADKRYPTQTSHHIWWSDPEDPTVQVCSCGEKKARVGAPPGFDWGYCETYLTPRHAMQQLGGEFAEATFPAIYATRAVRLAKKFSDSPPTQAHSFITDLRFIRDLEAAKTAGAVIVRIKRNGDGLKGAAATHKGEQARLQPEFLHLVDHFIDNNGTLGDLKQKVEALATQLKGTG